MAEPMRSSGAGLRRGCVLVFMLAVSTRSAAVAQEAEPLLTSASRYAQTTYEAPASVTVIGRDEIQRFGYRTLAELLSSAAGLFTSYDRNYTYLTVRGLARLGDFNTRVLILLDGRRLNAPTDDSGAIGTEGLVDLDALERVEIIRGPGSVLYGTNALYAVVNLVTRTGASLHGVEAAATGGSFRTGSASLAAGGRRAGGLDAYALVSGYSSRGPDLAFPELATEADAARLSGFDGDDYGRALVRVMKGDFMAEAFLSRRHKDVPTASFGTLFGDPEERTRDGAAMVSGAYEHAFADLSRVWATASFNDSSYDGSYPYDDGLLRDYIRARWVTAETQYQRLIGSHRFSAGTEARWNSRLAQGVAGDFADERRTWVLAAFAQGELHFGPAATLYAGARYDHYQSFGGTFSPRLALVAQPIADTYVKAIYSRAFRAPSSYELFYEDGSVTQKPALALDPERLETFEVALERRVRPGLKAEISAYHTRVRGLISLTTDPADDLLVFANIDRARTRGLEMGLEGQIHHGVFVRGSYALQDAVAGDDDARPANSPRSVARLGLSLESLGGRVVYAGELRHVGARPTLAGAQVGAYTLVNLGLTLRPRPDSPVELRARVTNALDTSFADPGGEEHRQDSLRQDGPSASIGFRVRF